MKRLRRCTTRTEVPRLRSSRVLSGPAPGTGAAHPWHPLDCGALRLVQSLVAAAMVVFMLLSWTSAQTKPAASQPTTQPAEKLVPIKTALPKPRFVGTPKDLRSGNLPPKGTKAPPKVKVPAGVTNVAKDKAITASDDEPIIGDLEMVTDGDKEAADGSFVELGDGKQYVQIDLGKPHEIFAVVVWHDHRSPRVYRDMVVVLSGDGYFVNKTTVFNNDHDNSSGLGRGKDYEYVETYQGKQIAVAGLTARYVRLYSNGNTAGRENVYTEVEVYGRPAK